MKLLKFASVTLEEKKFCQAALFQRKFLLYTSSDTCLSERATEKSILGITLILPSGSF